MSWEDIIGAEDIVGAEIATGYNEMDSIFGASRALVVGADPSAVANPSAVATTLASRHSAMVVQRPVTKAREYPLGFPTTSVAAGASQTISTQPQVPFRGRRLLVPSDIAGSFLIQDLKIGKNSMFPSANPVPARAFTELGVGVDLNLDTAQISQLVSIAVQNTTGGAVSFNACIIGTAVE
jgi:hypothetical protein